MKEAERRGFKKNGVLEKRSSMSEGSVVAALIDRLNGIAIAKK